MDDTNLATNSLTFLFTYCLINLSVRFTMILKIYFLEPPVKVLLAVVIQGVLFRAQPLYIALRYSFLNLFLRPSYHYIQK